MASSLNSLPDKGFVDYIIQGIQKGFRTGFYRYAIQGKSASCNMSSAINNPGPVDSY